MISYFKSVPHFCLNVPLCSTLNFLYYPIFVLHNFLDCTELFGFALIIFSRLDEEPPTARVVPKVWNGQPGGTHQFKCHTTGVPPPQITWTGPDGRGLPEGVVDLGEGILEITNAKQSVHQGELVFHCVKNQLLGDYTCTAVNVVGEASDKGSVLIGSSITLITTPHGPRIVLTKGEPLEIKCEAFGEPDPDVEVSLLFSKAVILIIPA